MITKCKCGQEIIWIKTAAGRNHPINAKASKLWVKDEDSMAYSLADCHESHFTTCPNADEFRKKPVAKQEAF